MTVQFVEIAGLRVALLEMSEYERLIDAAEERADLAAAIRAEQRREEGEEYLPHDVAALLLDGANPIKVWRKHRGMTQAELAAAVGCEKAYISKLEHGAEATSSRLKALAKALEVSVDDILPLD